MGYTRSRAFSRLFKARAKARAARRDNRNEKGRPTMAIVTGNASDRTLVYEVKGREGAEALKGISDHIRRLEPAGPEYPRTVIYADWDALAKRPAIRGGMYYKQIAGTAPAAPLGMQSREQEMAEVRRDERREAEEPDAYECVGEALGIGCALCPNTYKD